MGYHENSNAGLELDSNRIATIGGILKDIPL